MRKPVSNITLAAFAIAGILASLCIGLLMLIAAANVVGAVLTHR